LTEGAEDFVPVLFVGGEFLGFATPLTLPLRASFYLANAFSLAYFSS
jgi:hypothetical protein